jgi:ferredoxin-NADP reductase/hemoglobin-like flavoprotein
VVTRALRWLVRRDHHPDPATPPPGPAAADPTTADVPPPRRGGRRTADRNQPPSRRGAAASGVTPTPRVSPDRRLVVQEPVVRFPRPDLPALFNPPTGPGATTPTRPDPAARTRAEDGTPRTAAPGRPDPAARTRPEDGPPGTAAPGRPDAQGTTAPSREGGAPGTEPVGTSRIRPDGSLEDAARTRPERVAAATFRPEDAAPTAAGTTAPAEEAGSGSWFERVGRAGAAEPGPARDEGVVPGESGAVPVAVPRSGADPRPGGPDAELVRERQLVRQAVSLVDDQERLVRDFYTVVFAMGGPDVIGMFPSDLRRQRQEFGRTLVQWVTADDPAALTAHLDQLGADHRKFDVEPAHYAVAGEALVAAIRGRSGGLLTAAHEEALRSSYGRLATVMISGALRTVAEPPYWRAEVVGHRRHTDDFAVVTVQPAAPYPYRAGQYTTVELERRPKLWRQMSIASAPRPDNTIDLHVRAVPGGDVSVALVMHTRVGDRLKVGPPRGGALVVEPGTADSLLCLAAGAGAAPIAAVVESVLSWRTPPTLYAYVGARTADDLYPVRHLTSRALGLPHVKIQGIVSDEPGFPGLRGRIESVAPGLAPWASLGVEVLVSGPARMMDRTVTNLRSVGVPPEKIHFDQYEATSP